MSSTDKKQVRAASIKETGEELPDDQWKRFEAAVDAAVKSGPKHRPATDRVISNDDRRKQDS